MIRNILVIAIAILTGFVAFASKPNLQAPQGGNFVRNLGGEPTTLHPITSTDWYSTRVHDYTLDSLLSRNISTYDWEPRLAEKWEVSKDNKVFTFFLRKDIVFHDGKPTMPLICALTTKELRKLKS
jgi:peptide/nickel transport system substrate-binding protein/microcin C transport system substrate-binding protein